MKQLSPGVLLIPVSGSRQSDVSCLPYSLIHYDYLTLHPDPLQSDTLCLHYLTAWDPEVGNIMLTLPDSLIHHAYRTWQSDTSCLPYLILWYLTICYIMLTLPYSLIPYSLIDQAYITLQPDTLQSDILCLPNLTVGHIMLTLP